MTMDKDFTQVSIWFKFLFVLFLSTAMSISIYAQEKVTVTGKVTDAETSKPISNVSVMVKGTAQEVVTDEAGNYAISATVGSTLQFMYLANAPKDVKVQKAGTLNVSLDVKAKDLQEVVVIGYGTRTKKDITGAVSSITSKDIEKSTSMTAELALQGNTPGVFVESGGGSPFARPTIRIRGVSSFGFSEPLYVVDGVPIFEGGSNENSGTRGDIRTPLNIFTLINPNDIESMSVLKDASAAAIYGVRAGNGVILITTKKGKIGAPKVDFSSSYGIQNISKKIKTLNTQQYFSLINEIYAANPDAETSLGAKFGPRYDITNSLYQGNAPTYNWQDELKNDNAGIQDYSVKVSGGSESTSYYFSTGYSKTESPLKGNGLERYSTALNLESKISKFIQTGINLRLSHQDALDNTQGDLGSMISTVPFQPIYDANDPLGYARVTSLNLIPTTDTENPYPSLVFDGDPNDPKNLIWGPQSRYNPFAFQKLNSNKFRLLNVFGNAFLQIEPLKGLRLKATIGTDYRDNLRKSFASFNEYKYSQTPANRYDKADPSAAGSYGERNTREYNLNKEFSINYVKTFAKNHSFDLLLNASDQYSNWRWSDGSSPINSSNPRFWRVESNKFSTARTELLREDNLLGYMGRLSYKFKDKYYLDATIRRDGSSRLAPGKKWDIFPSFAAAWRISSESFFPKNTFVDDLKIRGGWGRLGNFLTARPYQYLSNINFNPNYFFGSGNGENQGIRNPALSFPNYANVNLTWENVQTSNIGLDAVLIKTKVNFSAEYYNRMSRNVIQPVELPASTGIEQTADVNVANVRNNGFEFLLGYNDRFGDVGFNVSANLTTVKNKVISIYNGTPFGGEYGRNEEGKSMNYLWGYKVGGIFQNQAEIDAWKDKNPGGDVNTGGYTYKPGDMYFQDINGDGKIDANDRTQIGKSVPGYFYGLNLGADYKGLDFTVLFQGVGDVSKFNGLKMGLESMSGIANQSVATLNRWTPENPSTTIPRAMFNDRAAALRPSDRFLENAAYLRLKTLQLGYTLNKSTLGKNSFAQRIRLYVSGVNLFTATKYTGLDPENDGLPPTRQFIFGLNASF